MAPASRTVRRLDAADAPAYRSLMLAAYLRHPEAFTSSHAEREGLPLSWWERRIGDAAQADEQVLGAFDDDILVGAAGLSRLARERERHKATLFGMVVAPEARRTGCGERLVAAVLQAARAQAGLRVVELTVSQGNDAALRLYERAGFVCFGVEPLAVSLGDAWITKLHLAIDLAAPRDTWLLADSEVRATESRPGELLLRCSAAGVRRTVRGETPLAGHLAPLTLRLAGASVVMPAPAWGDCSGRLREADLRIDGVLLARLDLPFHAQGVVQLGLLFGNGSRLLAHGAAVSAVSGPAPRFVESLAC